MKSTKELARELGFLRKRSISSPSTLSRCGSKVNDQPFCYLVVIDFESTCWENSKFRTQEIIEFPAVLLNTKTGEVEDEFHHYVMPQEQPILSEFCTSLTGITQNQVEAGIPIALCLKKFSHWLDKLHSEKAIVFPPYKTGQVPATFVTWSDWDLGVCLQYECRRKQLLKPGQLNNWIDLRATYTKFYERRPNGLHGALQSVGIEFEGRQHSGLDDAKNTAKLAWRMIRDGCKLNITKSIKGSTGNQKVITTIDTAPGYGKSKQNFTPLKAKRMRSSPPKTTHESENVNNSKCSELVEKEKLLCNTENFPSTSTKINLGVKQASIKIFCDSEAAKTVGVSSKDCMIKKDHCGVKTCVSGLTAHNTTDTVYRHTNVQTGEQTSFLKKFEPNSNEIKIISMSENPSLNLGSTLKMNASRPTTVTNNTTPKFNANTCNPAQLSRMSSFKIPPYNSDSKTMRGTPPMCQCGRRSKRRIAQSPGPNFGRFFFTCCRKQKADSDENKGCNFFKWEENEPKRRLPSTYHSFSVGHDKSVITPVQVKSKSFCVASVYKPFTPVVTTPLSTMSKKNLGMKSTFLRL